MKFQIKTTSGNIYHYSNINGNYDIPVKNTKLFYKNKHTDVSIILGFKCNQHCIYCNQDYDRNTYPNEIKISDEQYKKLAETIVEKVKKYYPSNTYNFTFWGGEALLYKHAIDIMYPILNSISYNNSFGVMTNGRLLPQCKDLLEHHNMNFVVSYDGSLTDYTRKYNPAKDINVVPILKTLADQHKLTIGAVLTPYHKNYTNLFKDVEDTLPLSEYKYNDVKCVYPYSDFIAEKLCFKKENLPQLEQDIYEESCSGLLVKSDYFKNIEAHVYNSLVNYDILPLKNFSNYLAIHVDGTMTFSHADTPITCLPNGESCSYGNIYTFDGCKPEHSKFMYEFMKSHCNKCFCRLFQNYGCRFSLHNPDTRYRDMYCDMQRARLTAIFKKVFKEVTEEEISSIEPITE